MKIGGSVRIMFKNLSWTVVEGAGATEESLEVKSKVDEILRPLRVSE